MSRASHQKLLPSSFYRLFADNSVVLIGIAFDLGLALGRRTGSTPVGKKVSRQMTDMVERVVELAPSSVAKLVPDLAPAKTRAAPRRKSKKRTSN
jgi:hypothetical protein